MDHAIPPSEFRRRWTEDDQDEVLGFVKERRDFERSLCRDCGTHPQEWDDYAATHDGEPAFVVADATCRGCQALDYARHSMSQLSQMERAGVHLALQPRDEALLRDVADE